MPRRGPSRSDDGSFAERQTGWLWEVKCNDVRIEIKS